MEPEIIDLQKFLNKIGAKIKGAGTNKIIIEGVKKLQKDIEYNIMPDRIETGTFLCVGAITGGNIIVKKANPLEISPIINKLEEAGCKLNIKKHEIEIISPKRLKSIDLKTMPYPGFPTDMQSIFGATLVLAKGTSIIVENIFENRFKYVQELNKMGVKAKIEGKVLAIKGVKKIYGAKVKAEDLRGGAALVIAALVTKNETEIENIKYILRGYEKFDIKLRKIGANILLKESE